MIKRLKERAPKYEGSLYLLMKEYELAYTPTDITAVLFLYNKEILT